MTSPMPGNAASRLKCEDDAKIRSEKMINTIYTWIPVLTKTMKSETPVHALTRNPS
jgi:hypothetical protein